MPDFQNECSYEGALVVCVLLTFKFFSRRWFRRGQERTNWGAGLGLGFRIHCLAFDVLAGGNGRDLGERRISLSARF